MKERQRNKISCEIYLNPNKSWLEKAWLDLEQYSNSSIFLSWLWIGTWIECFIDDFYVIEAKQNDKTIGLGIIVVSSDKIFGMPYKRKYYLHRSGKENYDQIWIEYNDFLLNKNNESDIRAAMIEYLFYNLTKSNSIVIGASDEKKFDHIEQLGLIKRTLWQTKNFALDLDKLRDNNQTLLQHLSRNSRYQIQRSIRKYQHQYGEINIEKAESLEQAKEMLLLAKPLHLARWNRKHDKSGFINLDFIKFHERLIEKGMTTANIDLYHIKAGNKTISIMYNLKYDNRIYFYLSAINYENISSQFKPGLVSHYLLINKALDDNIALYDFMGGASRYKKSFTNIEGNLSVNIYESASLKVSLMHAFRDSKLKLKKKREKKFCEVNPTF